MEEAGERSEQLGDEPTPEANRYGVGSAARLKLRQQVTDVGLHGLLREEETLADLPVDKSVGDELQNLDLAVRGLLLELPERLGKRDDSAASAATAPCRRLVEAPAVVHITAQDLLTLRGVHESIIGAAEQAL